MPKMHGGFGAQVLVLPYAVAWGLIHWDADKKQSWHMARPLWLRREV